MCVGYVRLLRPSCAKEAPYQGHRLLITRQMGSVIAAVSQAASWGVRLRLGLSEWHASSERGFVIVTASRLVSRPLPECVRTAEIAAFAGDTEDTRVYV